MMVNTIDAQHLRNRNEWKRARTMGLEDNRPLISGKGAPLLGEGERLLQPRRSWDVRSRLH